MKKAKKKIAVIYGGKGYEHDISALGGKFVLSVLDREKFDPLPILIDKSGDWFAEYSRRHIPISPIRRGGIGGILQKRRFIPIDAAFPVLHGDFGEDGRVQGLLDTLGFPFVGCDTVSGAISSDKSYTKSVALALGIPTLPWLCSDGEADDGFCALCEEKLGFPVFVKPARLGSSIGAGIARDRSELYERVRLARELGGRVIAEKYLPCPRELECAVLDFYGTRHVTPPGEISIDGGFYGYSEKYDKGSPARISTHASTDSSTDEQIRSYAEKISRALDVKGLARVDFFLFGSEIYFNEINTMPGMTEASLYPRLIRNLGIEAAELVSALIENAIGGAP